MSSRESGEGGEVGGVVGGVALVEGVDMTIGVGGDRGEEEGSEEGKFDWGEHFWQSDAKRSDEDRASAL